MQQYEKQIKSLGLKNSYLQKQIEFENSIQKKSIFALSLLTSSFIAIIVIFRSLEIVDAFLAALILTAITSLLKLCLEALVRLIRSRLRT